MAYIEPASDSLARIKVIGIGGGGQNAINSMIESGTINGVEFIAMNTDTQALNSSAAQVRVRLGPERTGGLGSGSDPVIGMEAAQESIDEIRSHLQGADMVFVTAGFGGGTGTGASPIIAQLAKETNALTVGVVTKPFEFEGKRRMNQADQGIKELKANVDALIVIPNEKLLTIVGEEVPLRSAFKVADRVVGNAVEGISDLITSIGLVNVDFADVKSIMYNAGSALMGVGNADGEDRAEKAAKAAINSPLLDVDIKGSTGILINIVGDDSLTMHEVNKAAKIVADAAHEGANIIFGANVDSEVDGLRVTVIATGFDSEYSALGKSDYKKISNEEVLDQIGSRFDYDNDDDDDDDDDDYDNDGGSKSVKNTDSEEVFDIEKMREQVKEMEEADKKEQTAKESESEKDGDETSKDGEENTSIWKFLSRKS